MNEDPFEKLARLISESHDDLATRIVEVESILGTRIDKFQTEVREMMSNEPLVSEVRAAIAAGSR